MLKWFKKLTDRLFGDEIEEEYVEEFKDTESQYAKKTNDKKEDERPAFRFPIITDAEIYGWEEDDAEEIEREQSPIVKDFKDDFEPTPLYQNERWPQQKQKNIVHRSRQSLDEEHTEQGFTAAGSEKSEALKTELKTIQKRIRMDRFTPSVVPSPVYGYQMPRRKTETVKEPLLEEQLPSIKEQEEDELLNAQTSSTMTVPGGQMYTAEGLVGEQDNSGEDALNSIEVEAIQEHSIVEAKLVEESSLEDVVDSECSPIESLEESITIPEQLADESEQQVGVDEVEPIVVGEVESSNEESVVTEDVVLEADNEEPITQEHIRPFNVLMLKSDRKRLKAIEIANEMKAKECVVVQEETSFVAEENLEELAILDELKDDPIEVTAPTVFMQEEAGVLAEAEDVAPILIEEQSLEHYVLPSLSYLLPPESQIEDTEWLASQSEKLEESLSHFGVQANVIDAVQGPTVTRFELTVGQGTKVSRVRNLADDLKLTLAARDIRIQAPIPGKSSIGIEIPNRNARAVRISEVIGSEAFQNSNSPLEAVLGLGLTGEPETLDLRKMPHGMIAGATGSGKSVCINSILVSLLYKSSPADLKMMLIDPKMVELAPFNGIPHLISPVITDVKAATAALKWAVGEMDRRYELLAHAGVRDIERYNEKVTEHRQFSLKMPYLLIVIDELADLMMMAPADVEVSISRIAQKARACGIHLIIATQRPSVDVITGIIKANIPTRIAFSVSSQVDSRTMIDINGAERLLGRGDMLYVGNGESTPVRLQGTFVTDDEIERIIEHVQNEASPTYLFGQDELLKSAVEEDEDPLFIEACQFIIKQDSASTSMLQRNFSIGYNRAAKLMDRFEKLKYISPQQGSRARDVYLTEEALLELKENKL